MPNTSTGNLRASIHTRRQKMKISALLSSVQSQDTTAIKLKLHFPQCYQHNLHSTHQTLEPGAARKKMEDYLEIIQASGGMTEPPAELLKPLKVPQGRLLLTPGPTNLSSRVRLALASPNLGHMNPETFQMMDEIKAGLRYLFQTDSRLVLAISAAAHAGMEASLGNLLEPGETVLVIQSGLWGMRAADMSRRLRARVEVLTTQLGEPATLEELEAALERVRPAVVFVAQSESSTGMKQPLQGFGDLVRRHNALLIVDMVASAGGEPFFMDAWKVDVVYAGAQKILGAPPGLTPIAFNARAEKKISSRKSPVPVFYFDMQLLGEYWNCFGGSERPYHHTLCLTLVYGLREALAQLAEEGLEACWRRHAAASRKLYQGLHQRGLELLIKRPEHRLTAVTAILPPPGVDPKIIVRTMLEKWNIEISGGLGPTAGKILRVGFMGPNACPERVDTLLRALDDVLTTSKHPSKL